MLSRGYSNQSPTMRSVRLPSRRPYFLRQRMDDDGVLAQKTWVQALDAQLGREPRRKGSILYWASQLSTHQEGANQQRRICVTLFGYRVVQRFYPLHCEIICGCHKRRSAIEEKVQCATYGPKIGTKTVICLLSSRRISSYLFGFASDLANSSGETYAAVPTKVFVLGAGQGSTCSWSKCRISITYFLDLFQHKHTQNHTA